MKVLEYLSTLKEPYRSKAINNSSKIALEYEYKENTLLASVISSAFNWSKSPEGHDYWSELVSDMGKNEEKYLDIKIDNEMSNKTIKYYINSLKDPYRIQAFTYAKKEGTLDILCDSLTSSLKRGFGWADTTEGHSYWAKIVNDIKDNKIQNYVEMIDNTKENPWLLLSTS
jgi:hypothetical protein